MVWAESRARQSPSYATGAESTHRCARELAAGPSCDGRRPGGGIAAGV